MMAVLKYNCFPSMPRFLNIGIFIFQHLKKKNRVKLVEYFIDVAKECINIGNFNSLMAIIAGMNMNPVARLKKTVS
jgi:hypothetical protein